jgi:hypothetical protein
MDGDGVELGAQGRWQDGDPGPGNGLHGRRQQRAIEDQRVGTVLSERGDRRIEVGNQLRRELPRVEQLSSRRSCHRDDACTRQILETARLRPEMLEGQQGGHGTGEDRDEHDAAKHPDAATSRPGSVVGALSP